MDIRGVSVVYHIPTKSIPYIYSIYPYSYCFLQKMETRRLVPQIRSRPSCARAAHHGIRGPSLEPDDLDALACRLAHRSHADVYVCALECGKRPEKRAAVLATSADISSSLSHEETGCSNQGEAQKYGCPRGRFPK